LIKGVIFDLDGTICDTLPLCIAAFKKAIEPRAGKRLSDQEIVATFGPTEEGTIMALVPQFYEQSLKDYLKYYEELHGMCPKPFDGIEDILCYLKGKGIIVALVTGKGRKSCELSLKFYGMSDSFDRVETGSPLGQRKAEGIRAVLERFGLGEDETLYVGDAPSDVDAARKAGVTMISALWGSFVDSEAVAARRPDHAFKTVEEFARYLKQAYKSAAPEISS
jgi:phosphoglycolate phosphatase/pyrophosphatase PpaX